VFIVAEALFTVDGGVPLVRATTTTILR
jgi:hypothetical protein